MSLDWNLLLLLLVYTWLEGTAVVLTAAAVAGVVFASAALARGEDGRGKACSTAVGARCVLPGEVNVLSERVLDLWKY